MAERPRRSRAPIAAAIEAQQAPVLFEGGAAFLIVAFLCAMSGLFMGLCLAMSVKPALAFLFGVVLAGGAAWYGRALFDQVRLPEA